MKSIVIAIKCYTFSLSYLFSKNIYKSITVVFSILILSIGSYYILNLLFIFIFSNIFTFNVMMYGNLILTGMLDIIIYSILCSYAINIVITSYFFCIVKK